MSLGPGVQWEGNVLLTNTIFKSVRSISPLMLSVPARFSIIAILHMLVAAALIVESTKRTWVTRFASLAIALPLVEYLPVPIRMKEIAPSPSLFSLRDHPEIEAVHDFSGSAWDAMIGQIAHKKTITAAFLARRPKEALKS